MAVTEVPTFSFVVPLEFVPGSRPPDPTKWLGLDGREVTKAEDAVRFVFRLHPNMRDELAIENRHDEAVGIADVVDLEHGIERTRARLLAIYEAELWPDGRPKNPTPEEAQAQEKAIDEKAFLDTSTDRRVLARMERLQELHRVCAEWPVMIVDAPEGWKTLDDKPMRPGIAGAIVEAYTSARYAELLAEGK